MRSVMEQRTTLFVCALLWLVRLSQQAPTLTTTSVYPFAPFFVVQPSNVTVSSGVAATEFGSFAFAYPQMSQSQVNSITLPCQALANPSPTFQWRINGTLISPNSQYSYAQSGPGDLTISPLSPGIYQCIVTSGSAVAYSDIVNLTAAFLQISSQAVTSQVTIVQGSYYCMPQNATKYNSFPTPIVTWQRETSATDPNGYAFQAVKYDNRVIRDELGRTHITYAKQSDCCDANWKASYNIYRLRYQLELTNLQLIPLLNTLTVPQKPDPTFQAIQLRYVTPSPVVALAGTSVRIVCIYSGTPDIYVSYVKIVNGNQVSVNSGPDANVLLIIGAQLSDSGTYQCQATQSSAQSGTINPTPQTISLTVLSPPQWVVQPSDVFVPVGGQVTVPCIAVGNPAVSTQWLVNGVTLQSNNANQMVLGTNYTLINAQKPTDNRAVQCVVQNSYATYVANAAITVITPTQITSPPANRLQINPGSVVSFTCEGLGDPLLTVNIAWTWTDLYGNAHLLYNAPPGIVINAGKNGSDSQQTLTIDTSQFGDKNLVRGSYTCMATNGWSAANATARLSFLGDADGLVAAASFEWWILGLILAILLLLAIILLIIFCCRRNRGATYGVDEKERAQGNNPTEDLKRMHAFTEYVRPDSQPMDGSRTATLDRSHAPPAYSNDTPSRPESEIGEDGSFRGAYGAPSPPNRYTPPQGGSQNAAFQPPAGEYPPQPTYYAPPPPSIGTRGYNNSAAAINDSIV